ncbi:MAG: hypothetical protein IJU76_09380 [Desulfovibrionaceae bacterium]|nr:hypothetical protein [Desulfovibrionaceae bacterium]
MSRAKLIEHDHYENSAYPHQFNSETEYDEWFQKRVKSALQLAENEDNFISEEEAEAHVKEFFKSLR